MTLARLLTNIATVLIKLLLGAHKRQSQNSLQKHMGPFNSVSSYGHIPTLVKDPFSNFCTLKWIVLIYFNNYGLGEAAWVSNENDLGTFFKWKGGSMWLASSTSIRVFLTILSFNSIAFFFLHLLLDMSAYFPDFLQDSAESDSQSSNEQTETVPQT